MRKLIRLVVLVAILAGGVGAFLFWSTNQESAEHYSIAEKRISAAISENKTQLNLRDLDQLTELPANIAEMQSLTELKIRDTRITDLALLAKLQNLEILDIGDTWVTDLEPLAKNKSLSRLDIGGLQILSLEPATRIENLSWINLRRAYALDGSKQHYETLSKIGRSFGEDGDATDFHIITTKVFNGTAFQQNYIPDQIFLSRVKAERLKKTLGLSEISDQE